jgi:ABC-2 type transport system ATP-binding protein
VSQLPIERAGSVGGPGAVLSCDGLTYRFGDRLAVDGVTFGIAPGETYGLLGPNGAGKTTTIRMICALLNPESGSVAIAGRDVRDDAGAKALVGYVPQELALYPDLTAAENLRFFGALYGLRGRDLQRRVGDVLELVDLVDRANDRVDSFSGGMKRRLNIGAGLVHGPTLLVLDEPTVGVDPQSRHAILSSVQAFGTQGMAVLYTTHYMEEAQRLCDRVGIMDHGRLVAEGTTRELVSLVTERDRIDVSLTGDPGRFAVEARALPGVERADVLDGSVQLLVAEGRRLLPAVLDVAERTGVAVRTVDVVEPDLESVFLHLTGTALRE